MKASTKTFTVYILFVALAALAMFGALTWTGADKDLAAYVKGDYVTAAAQFREAAEQGNAAAQHNLALLYDTGKGVPQDDNEATKWYRLAADQGYSDSQYNLSMRYYFGKGVPQDYVAAYKWLILANTPKKAYVEDAMATIAEKMSQEQIAEAQDAAQAWTEGRRR